MTSNYKILGQLYYGPEINETPEIPGTSGYYTYTVGSKSAKYIVIGYYDDSIYYSEDGISWTMNYTGLNWSESMWSSVTYGDGKYFITGYDYSRALYSQNGKDWSVIDFPYNSGGWWGDSAYGNGKFIVTSANNNAIAISTDGLNWNKYNNPTIIDTVIFFKDKFYGYSYYTNLMSSTDGITWSVVGLPVSGGNVYRIATSNDKMVMIYPINGTNDVKILTTTDFASWSIFEASNQTVEYLVYGAGKFYAGRGMYEANGFGGFISTDGIDWTSIGDIYPSYGNDYHGPVLGSFDKILLLPGQYSYDTKPLLSTDGITYTPIETNIFIPKYYTDVLVVETNTLQEVQIAIGGQGTPGSYVEIVEPQTLYTVPAGKQVIVSAIFVTNHDTVTRTYDLAVVPSGEELAAKHHIKWDYAVASNDFNMLDQKITMNAGDSIHVFPSTVNKIGFTAMGVEL